MAAQACPSPAAQGHLCWVSEWFTSPWHPQLELPVLPQCRSRTAFLGQQSALPSVLPSVSHSANPSASASAAFSLAVPSQNDSMKASQKGWQWKVPLETV